MLPWYLPNVYQTFDLLHQSYLQTPFVCDTFIEQLCFTSDINECDQNMHGCDSNATCTNTNGSFTCSCNDGYSGDGMTCSG